MGNDDPGKATARGDGVVRIDPAHSPECCGSSTLRDLQPSSGWQDETIASTHDQRFTTRFRRIRRGMKPCRSSFARRPAGKSNGGGAVAPILFPARAGRFARCEFFAAPGTSAIFADIMFASIFSHNSV
jgi:hypothetical protein